MDGLNHFSKGTTLFCGGEQQLAKNRQLIMRKPWPNSSFMWNKDAKGLILRKFMQWMKLLYGSIARITDALRQKGPKMYAYFWNISDFLLSR